MTRPIKFRAWTGGKMTKATDIEWLKRDAVIPDDFHQLALWEPDAIFMQFTGLLDKNGNEIYESDIVKTERATGQVFYRLGCWYVSMGKELGYYNEPIEVIGNIYENPELLNT